MLTATEFHMREPLPLHRVHAAILEFCIGRSDIAVFGAQAVNVYVSEPRMTQDVDLLSPTPRAVADELARALHALFHIAVRVRDVRAGKGFRVFQVRGEGNRHLADVRLAEVPLEESVGAVKDGIQYVSLPFLVAMKICAFANRREAPKGATDLADLRRLLLAHPQLREAESGIDALLDRTGGGPQAHAAWAELLGAAIVADEDEGY
jgi:hypothetical protein